MKAATVITIETKVKASAKKVWDIWNDPAHIVRWNTATPEWHTPRAQHDLRPGGQFNFRMEARDGSTGFDFSGVYDVVKPHQRIEYTMGDNRKVKIEFTEKSGETHIVQSFEAESTNPVEMQRDGWQAILDSFKRYVEGVG